MKGYIVIEIKHDGGTSETRHGLGHTVFKSPEACRKYLHEELRNDDEENVQFLETGMDEKDNATGDYTAQWLTVYGHTRHYVWLQELEIEL